MPASRSCVAFRRFCYICVPAGEFFKMPIVRESNAASVIHWLSGGKPQDVMSGGPDTYVAGVLLGLEEATWHPLLIPTSSDINLKRSLFSDSSSRYTPEYSPLHGSHVPYATRVPFHGRNSLLGAAVSCCRHTQI